MADRVSIARRFIPACILLSLAAAAAARAQSDAEKQAQSVANDPAEIRKALIQLKLDEHLAKNIQQITADFTRSLTDEFKDGGPISKAFAKAARDHGADHGYISLRAMIPTADKRSLNIFLESHVRGDISQWGAWGCGAFKLCISPTDKGVINCVVTSLAVATDQSAPFGIGEDKTKAGEAVIREIYGDNSPFQKKILDELREGVEAQMDTRLNPELARYGFTEKDKEWMRPHILKWIIAHLPAEPKINPGDVISLEGVLAWTGTRPDQKFNQPDPDQECRFLMHNGGGHVAMGAYKNKKDRRYLWRVVRARENPAWVRLEPMDLEGKGFYLDGDTGGSARVALNPQQFPGTVWECIYDDTGFVLLLNRGPKFARNSLGDWFLNARPEAKYDDPGNETVVLDEHQNHRASGVWWKIAPVHP